MNARERQKKLKDAERAGNAALRQALEEILEECAGNPEVLAALADFCEEQAFDACERGDGGLQGTWMFMHDRTCVFARQGLDESGWHRFLKAKNDSIPVRYL